MNLEVGDIIFVRGHTIISDLVRFFDKGEFSHVAMAVSPTHVIDAHFYTKSRIKPFYFKDYEIVRLNLSEGQKSSIAQLAPSQVGKWYDFLQILGFLLRGNFNNPNYLICTEIIANLLYAVGEISAQQHTHMVNLKPNELFRFIKEEVN